MDLSLSEEHHELQAEIRAFIATARAQIAEGRRRTQAAGPEDAGLAEDAAGARLCRPHHSA